MAREYLTELIESYGLCARFSHLQTAGGACFATINGSCIGICTNKKLVDEYNTLVGEAIDGIKADLGTFVLTGKGRNKEELTVVLVENGHYLGFGFLGIEEEISSIDLIKEKIVWRPDTPDIQYLLMRHIDKHPERRIILHSQSGN